MCVRRSLTFYIVYAAVANICRIQRLNENTFLRFSLVISGGACTHFLTLSSESQKLYNRAIIMSGTSFNIWAHTTNSIDDNLWFMFGLGKFIS